MWCERDESGLAADFFIKKKRFEFKYLLFT